MERFNTNYWSAEIPEFSRICLFIGAGVSMGCKTIKGEKAPSWEALIKNLENSYIDDDDKLTFASSLEGQFLDRAEVIEKQRVRKGITNNSFSTEVRNFVEYIDGDILEPSSFYDAVRRVNPKLIITTNYDTLVERALNSNEYGDIGYNVWTYPGRIEQIAANSIFDRGDIITLGDLLRSGEPLIVKIHGGVLPDYGQKHLKDEDYELVFSLSSYRRAYSRKEIVPSFLRAVFATHQVIFAGYSLNDQVLRDILSSQESLPGMVTKHTLLQTQDSVVNEYFKESFENFYGINVEPYADHEDLVAVLYNLSLTRS